MKKRLGSGKMSTSPKTPEKKAKKKTNKQTKLKSKTKTLTPQYRDYKRTGYKLSAQRFLGSCVRQVFDSYDWLMVALDTMNQS